MKSVRFNTKPYTRNLKLYQNSIDAMDDVFEKVYNGFFLRDVLGYIIPGSFVLTCLLHLFCIITNYLPSDLIKLIPNEGVFYFFLICLCYVCGHFLSGIFFHTPLLNKIFKYSPKQITSKYPGMNKDESWATHRSEYRKACAVIGTSIQGYIERHAALVHFTGHMSASLVFSICYLIFLAFYTWSTNPMFYAIPMIIVFPGIFIHYQRLSLERFNLEIETIKSAEKNGTNKA